MVAKRSFPFEEVQQGQNKLHVTEKVYNSSEERISIVYEKTLCKLISGSRDFFRTRRNSCNETKMMPLEMKNCISCHKQQHCGATCNFCEVAVCESCVRTCHACLDTFCHMCSIVRYGTRSNTAVCFSCK